MFVDFQYAFPRVVLEDFPLGFGERSLKRRSPNPGMMFPARESRALIQSGLSEPLRVSRFFVAKIEQGVRNWIFG